MRVPLMDKIKTLIDGDYNSEDYIELINKCREAIIEYKNNGGTQREAYNILLELYKLYDEMNMEERYNLTGDVLDIIVGYFGNKKMLIWEEYLET
jgi:hypothetical protein